MLRLKKTLNTLQRAHFLAVSLLLIMFFLCTIATGCQTKSDGAQRVSEYYCGLTSMNLLTDIVCDFEGYSVDFQLEFQYNAQGESVIKVLRPSEIEGVKVLLQDDEVLIDYEGISLETGLSDVEAVSPVGAIPELLRLWRIGLVSEERKEKVDDTECIYITYKTSQGGVELLYSTWFSADNLKPVKAEIFEDGYRKIFCEFLVCDKFE